MNELKDCESNSADTLETKTGGEICCPIVEESEVLPASLIGQKMIAIVSAAVIIACVAVNVVAHMSEEVVEEPENEPAVVVRFSEHPLPEIAAVEVRTEPVWSEHEGFSIERNEHFIGWIRIGDTIVNYPVVLKTDEHYTASGYTESSWYYLRRDFDGRYFLPGSLFIDRSTPIRDTRRPDNTVIYGHNMQTRVHYGTKFAYLMNYYDNFVETYLEHPTLQFTTIYDDMEDERNTYLIFAGALMNTEGRDGQVFDYFRRVRFDNTGRWGNSRDEFYDFIGNVLDRSMFITDVDLEFGDEIITLSTCNYPLGRDISTRYAFFARRLRPGEDLSALDLEAAHLNPSPLMFDTWYRRRGGSWEGRGWDTALVRGFDEWLSEMPDWCSTRPIPRAPGLYD
jgi:sortase B